MFLVDSHCHISDLNFREQHESFEDAYKNAMAAGVTHMLNICCELPSFQKMAADSAPYANVWPTAGTHPENISAEWTEEQLKECCQNPKVIAIGEVGLDYYYDADTKIPQQRDFIRQIAVARELRLPLVIHARNAPADTWNIVRSERAEDVGGIFHSCAESLDFVKKALDAGFYISVNGIITFKSGENIREIARYVPLDRLLVETDSPYLAPVPYRGRSNEPAFVVKTAEKLAEVKGVEYGRVLEQTSANFESLFGVSLAASFPG